MTYHKVDLLELAKRESASVEWKENVAEVSNVISTMVAFANDFLNLGGGYIVCGAKEMKDAFGFQSVEYVGLTAPRLKALKEQIINDCTNATRVNPPINPQVDELEVPEDPSRRVLVFTVDATRHAHTYKKNSQDIPRYYIKTDFNTKEATNGFIRDLLRRKDQLEPWDKRINIHASVTDLDELILRQYLQTMKIWSSNKSMSDYLSDKEQIEEFIPTLLGRTGLDKPIHPKNFTLMLFGKKPLLFCSGAYSIFTIFEGTNKSKQYAETQWISGPLVEQAHKLIELLNIEATIAIDKSSENANQVKYPKIALKEAVVNAIVHRDYEIHEATRVEVYSDRVEIYSPGGLPFNLDKNKFKAGTAQAAWRNQSFARIFQRLNLAQHQGSGIEKIITTMKEEGCPMPIFEVDHASVTCILPAHPRHRIMKQISDAESDIVIRDYTAAFKKLKTVLDQDIYNYRALELFCEVNNLLENPEQVLNLLQTKNIDYQQIRPNTLVVISETLSLADKNKAAENLSKELLNIALKGRLEERQLRKVAFTLKKLGDDKAVVHFVNQTLEKYPNLATNAALLNQKGRALIDLAKRCEATFNENANGGSFNKNTNHRIKSRAQEDFERYIIEAEKTLRLAHEYSEHPVDKDYIEKALIYIEDEMMPFIRGKSQTSLEKRTIFVSNIPKTASEKDIEEIYILYGAIDKISLKWDAKKRKKYAFVEFAENIFAEKALASKKNIFLGANRLYSNPYHS